MAFGNYQPVTSYARKPAAALGGGVPFAGVGPITGSATGGVAPKQPAIAPGNDPSSIAADGINTAMHYPAGTVKPGGSNYPPGTVINDGWIEYPWGLSVPEHPYVKPPPTAADLDFRQWQGVHPTSNVMDYSSGWQDREKPGPPSAAVGPGPDPRSLGPPSDIWGTSPDGTYITSPTSPYAGKKDPTWDTTTNSRIGSPGYSPAPGAGQPSAANPNPYPLTPSSSGATNPYSFLNQSILGGGSYANDMYSKYLQNLSGPAGGTGSYQSYG